VRDLRRIAVALFVALVFAGVSPGQDLLVNAGPILEGAVIYHFDPPEPGLDEAGGWFHYLVNSGLAIDGSQGYVSSPNALVLTFDRTPFHWGAAGAGKLVPVNAGISHRIAMMVKADATLPAITLRVQIFDKDPSGYYGPMLGNFLVSQSGIGSGWQLWSPGSITPSESEVIVEVVADGGAVNDVGIWAVDDFAVVQEMGEEMAVFLTGRVVRSVLALAKATLNAEIAFVELEANVGLDLPLVTGWRAYDPGLATPDVVEFETYERGPTTFPGEAYDQSLWHAGQRTRVISKTPMRAAINHANRGNADDSDATLLANQMAERSRWYGAALVRCFRNDPTCAQTELTIVPVDLRCNVVDPARLSTIVRRAARVVFDFDVYAQESPAGEMTLGAASLPSVNQETP